MSDILASDNETTAVENGSEEQINIVSRENLNKPAPPLDLPRDNCYVAAELQRLARVVAHVGEDRSAERRETQKTLARLEHKLDGLSAVLRSVPVQVSATAGAVLASAETAASCFPPKAPAQVTGEWDVDPKSQVHQEERAKKLTESPMEVLHDMFADGKTREGSVDEHGYTQQFTKAELEIVFEATKNAEKTDVERFCATHKVSVLALAAALRGRYPTAKQAWFKAAKYLFKTVKDRKTPPRKTTSPVPLGIKSRAPPSRSSAANSRILATRTNATTTRPTPVASYSRVASNGGGNLDDEIARRVREAYQAGLREARRESHHASWTTTWAPRGRGGRRGGHYSTPQKRVPY